MVELIGAWCFLIVEIVPANAFGECLLIEIVRTLDVGNCRLIGIVC